MERLGSAELPPALDAFVAKHPWVEAMLRQDPAGPGTPGAGATVRVEVGEVRTEVGFYRLRPSRVVLVDNRRGFGHREELGVPRRAADG